MLDIYESVTEVYIVLELAAGGELFDRIVKKGHYSEKEAARVCHQVLSALEVHIYVMLYLLVLSKTHAYYYYY
jgi:serine/threonine protein kinase